MVSKGCPTKTWQNPANPPAIVSIVDSVKRIVVIFSVYFGVFQGASQPKFDVKNGTDFKGIGLQKLQKHCQSFPSQHCL